MAPIIEYLGYNRFTPDAHYDSTFGYATSDGLKHHTEDVGYRLSPEYLMGLDIHRHSISSNCDHTSSGWECEPFNRAGLYADEAKTMLNTGTPTSNRCSAKFDPGEQYGQCSPRSELYHEWLDNKGEGCGGGACTCSPDAPCGMYYFTNQVMAHSYAGCNDMRSLRPSPTSSADMRHMRRVVKGFVDHNLPLMVIVRRGGHFMYLVGYYDLDSTGLPRNGIITDSGGRFSLVSLTDGWNEASNNSIRDLLPWNQHLDGGCDAGGWASKLDELPSNFKICNLPSGWTSKCMEKRIYGTRIDCIEERSNGSTWTRASYFANDKEGFINDDRLISCDRIDVRFADGEHRVRSASISRHYYSSTDEWWHRYQSYNADKVYSYPVGGGNPGRVSRVRFDSSWPQNYWLVAQGLSGTKTKRRSTLKLTLDDGSVRTIEISPPHTYGIELSCLNGSDKVVSSYWAEADQGVFPVASGDHVTKQFFYELADRSCYKVKARVSLGTDSRVVGATVERQLHRGAGSSWSVLTSMRWPDKAKVVSDGLSGSTREWTWDEAWSDGYWLVADNVSGGQDRKTVLQLRDGSGNVLRDIEVVPY